MPWFVPTYVLPGALCDHEFATPDRSYWLSVTSAPWTSVLSGRKRNSGTLSALFFVSLGGVFPFPYRGKVLDGSLDSILGFEDKASELPSLSLTLWQLSTGYLQTTLGSKVSCGVSEISRAMLRFDEESRRDDTALRTLVVDDGVKTWCM